MRARRVERARRQVTLLTSARPLSASVLIEAAVAAFGVAVAIDAWPVFAAVVPSISERLSGSSVAEVRTETIDVRSFTFSTLRGHAVLVNFFASWCPACQAEQKELLQLHEIYAQRGLQFIGVLLDPRETPDTLAQAREVLRKNPLPYPVVMMNESVQQGFRNQFGEFPATYFICPDGRFSSTLFGLQPQAQIKAVADRVLAPAPSSTTGDAPLSTDLSAEPSPTGQERSPWLALVPRNWKQWHPLVVHFPIALLFLEALLVVVSEFRPRASLEQPSRWLLAAALVSFVPTVYTGMGDVGADLGPGWGFWNGLEDRFRHLLLIQSTISLHVLFALAAIIIAVGRYIWRIRSGYGPLPRPQRAAFAALTILGVWALFAAGQVGGSISHE